MEQITKRLIGQEDVNWDDSGAGGRADFPGGDGQMKPLHKVNASHIPLTSNTRASVDGASNVDVAIASIAQKIAAISRSEAMTGNIVIDFLSSDSPTIMQNKINAQKKNLGGYTLTFRFPYGVDHHLLSSLVFDGFALGKLVVTGNTDDDRSNIFDDANISSLFRFEDCLCETQVRHFAFHCAHSECAIYALRDTSLLVSDCVFAGTKLGVKAEMAFAKFSGCSFDSPDKKFKLVDVHLDSTAFTGTPTAPTPSNTTDNTQIATTAFAKHAPFVGTKIGETGAQIDMDDVTDPGVFYINAGTLTHGPITTPLSCFVNVTKSTNGLWIVQDVESVSQQRKWLRTRGNSDWYPWKELSDGGSGTSNWTKVGDVYIQWGSIKNTTTITFPHAFTTTSYVVMGVWLAGSHSETMSFPLASRSTTKCTLDAYWEGLTLNWIAIGR